MTEDSGRSSKWEEEVSHRFSTEGAAEKWDAMYGSETPRYDEHYFRLRRERTLAFVEETFTHESELLDLGCGAGPVITPLRQGGYSCVGLDYSAEMLGFARKRLEQAGAPTDGLIRGDSTRLPFPDASFDGVICLGVISYVADYRPVLEEIYRVLRPGGSAVITFRNWFHLVLWDPWKTVMLGLRAAVGLSPNPPKHIGRFLDFREADQACRDVGFEFVDFWGIGFGPFRVFGKRVLPHRVAIPFSDAFTSAVVSRSPAAERWLSDVSAWIYRKPE